MHLRNKICFFTTIGVGLVSLATLLAIFWMDIYRALLSKELALDTEAKSFKLWKNPPVLNFDIYLYNWTNPTNLTDANYEKPILEQIGPYRFREIGTKTRVKFHPNNSTVSFRRRNTYYFDVEGSVGRLDDKITSLNPVAISAAHTVRYWSFISQKQVSMDLNLYSQQVHITKDASELLFDGYQDDLIDMARSVSNLGTMKLNIPYDRFGWFYGRNESEEIGGHFNMHTGKDDIMELGKAKTFNYKNETGYYDKPCDSVRGSAGEFYPPGQTKDKPLTFFNGELCRYLDLYYTEELDINGLKVNKYAATERSVDNGTKYSEYAGFSRGESVPSGVMNVSACRYGAPVFVSFPHFYAADPYYLDFVEGMKPSKEDHEFYIALDPQTGIPVEVAARLQVNIRIRSYPNIALYEEAPYMFFPVLWFEQKVRVPQELIDGIAVAASVPKIGYVCIGIIAGMGAVFLIWVLCQKIRGNENKPTETSCKDSCNKNGIEVIVKTPEQSPLMKPKKLLSDFEIMHSKDNNRPYIAPLAIAESDLEYADDKKFTARNS